MSIRMRMNSISLRVALMAAVGAVLVVSQMTPTAQAAEVEWPTTTTDGLDSTNLEWAFDASGMAHAAYTDLSTNSLFYAVQNGAGWTLTNLQVAGVTPLALLLDADGRPQILFTTGVNLFFTRLTDTGWETSVPPSPLPGTQPALALDPLGTPHLAYYNEIDPTTRELRLASLSGTTWTSEQAAPITPISSIEEMRTPSLGFGPTNEPQIAWVLTESTGFNESVAAVWHSERASSVWTTEAVDSVPTFSALPGFFRTTLAVNKDGEPYIFYTSAESELSASLKVANRDGAWAVADVDVQSNFALAEDMALDGSGNPHLFFLNSIGTAPNLQFAFGYAVKLGDGWPFSTLPPFLDLLTLQQFLDFGRPRLSLTASNVPQVSWFDPFSPPTTFKVATPNVADFLRWSILPVIESSAPPVDVVVGTFPACVVTQYPFDATRPSLALDQSGEVHHAYFGFTGLSTDCFTDGISGFVLDGNIIHSSNGGAVNVDTANIELLRNDGVSLSSPAGGGPPQVSYTSGLQLPLDAGSVKLATLSNTGVTLETVSAGRNPSLAHYFLVPVIAYESEGRIKLAIGGAIWTSYDIDAGFSPSLAVDPTGGAHIAYRSDTGDVKYAFFSIPFLATQSIAPVDATPGVSSGQGPSLALDPGNLPHIAYVGGDHDLKYAAFVGGQWAAETADSMGDVGAYASLDIDASGTPHVSYHDATVGAVKYATKVDGQWQRQVIAASRVTNGFSVIPALTGTSLVVGPDGILHVSYAESDRNVMYARGTLCGNGSLNVGEHCDDGNLDPSDCCDASCRKPTEPDTDGDRVADPCDNCVTVFNLALGTLDEPGKQPFQTTTGGQLDSDGDGYGNACDADFDNQGSVVGGVDLSHLLGSFNKSRDGNDCGTNADQPCEMFDLDNRGQFIGGSDIGAAFNLFNQAPGPKCNTCPLECSGPGC